MIRIGDTVVQVADLIIVHVPQILLVEVACEPLSEEKGQLLLDIVDA